jgi:hypothetical protein
MVHNNFVVLDEICHGLKLMYCRDNVLSRAIIIILVVNVISKVGYIVTNFKKSLPDSAHVIKLSKN